MHLILACTGPKHAIRNLFPAFSTCVYATGGGLMCLPCRKAASNWKERECSFSPSFLSRVAFSGSINLCGHFAIAKKWKTGPAHDQLFQRALLKEKKTFGANFSAKGNPITRVFNSWAALLTSKLKRRLPQTSANYDQKNFTWVRERPTVSFRYMRQCRSACPNIRFFYIFE